jgi:hypothetical protein
MNELSESWLLARKALKTADDAVAERDWDKAEAAAVAFLAFGFDFKMAVIAEKTKAQVA